MKKLTLLSTAAAFAFSGAAFAADAELTVFDWAGWDIPGAYAAYSAKHGDQPTYAFFGDDDEAFQRSRPASNPISPTPAPLRCRATAMPA